MQRIVLFLAIVLFCGRTAHSARVPAGPAIQDSLTSMLAGFKAETWTETPAVSPAVLPTVIQPTPTLSGTNAIGASGQEAQALDLRGFLSFWTQDCGNGCGLPQPAAPAMPAELSLPLPGRPGEATSARFERQAALGMTSVLQAKVTAFAVCPRETGSATSGGPAARKVSCPDRYFQIQVEVRGEAEVFCGMSMDEHDLVPFPVLMCAGTSKSEPSRRVGVTLHRKPL
ncbi:MAG: hypothetical protein HZB91_14125 [Elusimicrobia bacterium]|nr:hypothetical protein [Elusimicrobiota bacterium]